jgi:hypothetical protein
MLQQDVAADARRLPGVGEVAVETTTTVGDAEPGVVPSTSTALVKWNDTIEFSGECSINTPT